MRCHKRRSLTMSSMNAAREPRKEGHMKREQQSRQPLLVPVRTTRRCSAVLRIPRNRHYEHRARVETNGCRTKVIAAHRQAPRVLTSHPRVVIVRAFSVCMALLVRARRPSSSWRSHIRETHRTTNPAQDQEDSAEGILAWSRWSAARSMRRATVGTVPFVRYGWRSAQFQPQIQPTSTAPTRQRVAASNSARLAY